MPLDDYKELLGDNLANLRKRWLQPSSKTCVSVLLQTTSEILCLAAESTNSTINLSERKPAKSVKVPAVITRSLKRIKLTWRSLKRCSLTGSDAKISAASENHTIAKAKFRSLTRSSTGKQRYAEDQKMFALLSSTSSSGTIFRKIKALKKSSVEEIPFLKVGSKTFHGDEVKNGFYESIANLKAKTNKVDDFNFIDDYNNILDICKNKKDLPRISLDKSTKILKKMKQSVSDFFSITPAHYINGGEAGMEHFNFLLNCIIDDVNNATIEELNVCYALLLHKGHGKPRTIDKAYRTISSCPLLSKALDMYIRDLHKEKWNLQQAPTQYQGEGSCHELAALLLTEVIQHSVYVKKEPAYMLFLDAMSAFDNTAHELIIRNLYLSGMDGDTTIFVNNRLTNRITYIDWDKSILGPIKDGQGLEQGGANSSDYYKIYSNENLTTAQKSEQGIKLGNSQVISAIGLADDTMLTANKLSNLANLLYLTKSYCEKYGVTLCADKTKLLRISKCEIF